MRNKVRKPNLPEHKIPAIFTCPPARTCEDLLYKNLLYDLLSELWIEHTLPELVLVEEDEDDSSEDEDAGLEMKCRFGNEMRFWLKKMK
ncbi:hypothetical protein QVD17_22135 [Tagetes erecta]|uniref:Uncharacterized protein n=1 Tax=Tagetes erecta TaxID=13708 RepID=A0AAD8KG92_TARER|nr:hypothetical protein QVD17_22135 [Tagetes erecta]